MLLDQGGTRYSLREGGGEGNGAGRILCRAENPHIFFPASMLGNRSNRARQSLVLRSPALWREVPSTSLTEILRRFLQTGGNNLRQVLL